MLQSWSPLLTYIRKHEFCSTPQSRYFFLYERVDFNLIPAEAHCKDFKHQFLWILDSAIFLAFPTKHLTADALYRKSNENALVKFEVVRCA